jgi:hypothetical protein
MTTVQIDDTFLQEVGLGDLPQEKKQAFLQDALEMLQINIGVRLSENLTDEQMEELENKLTPEEGESPEAIAQKQQAIGEWLRSNHSNYDEVVREEVQKLKQTIRETMSTKN